jgi:hypothetical protein
MLLVLIAAPMLFASPAIAVPLKTSTPLIENWPTAVMPVLAVSAVPVRVAL